MGAEAYHQLADAILDLDRVEDIVVILRLFYVVAYMHGHGNAPIGALINQANLSTPIKAAVQLGSIKHNIEEQEMAEAETHIAIVAWGNANTETACGALATSDRIIGLDDAAARIIDGNTSLCKVCLAEAAKFFAKPAGLRTRKS